MIATRGEGQSDVLISVVMPVHNGAGSLDRAVHSLVRQTFPSWELLVVDDASTDGSRELAQVWASRDSRIRARLLPQRRGAGAAQRRAARGRRTVHRLPRRS